MVAKLISFMAWQSLKKEIIMYTQQKNTSKSEKQIQEELKALLN